MQIVTGKSVALPGLTTGSVGTESPTDAESVRSVMDRTRKMVEHFRSVEMRTKLEECQKERVYKYKK